jgi:hypothetical protein
MDDEQRRERRKEIAQLAQSLVANFRERAGLFTPFIEGPQQTKMRSMGNLELSAIARAARQVHALGIAAENLLAKRSAENRKQWQRQRNQKAFRVVRELSQMWIATGVMREVRLQRIAEMGKNK